MTIFKLRAPGMSLDRMPLFVWAMLVTSFMVIFAMPAVMVAQHHPDPRPAGRHALLQPGRRRRRAAVAAPVLVLRPPRGLHHLHSRRRASSRRSSPTFARRPMFGYPALVLSLIATGFLASGCGCTTCSRPALPQLGKSFFTAASMMIAIPSGVQIFCWIATLWTGRPRFDDAAAVRARLLLHLRARRADRRDARLGAARPAGARHVLRRRAPPLRADRRRGVPAVRRGLLLVPEDHRPDAERDARPLEFLARSSSASTSRSSRCTSSACGHAAARLHLSGRRWAGAR